MKRALLPPLLGVLCFAMVTPAHAFGDKGHSLVGKIAEIQLKDTRALKEVRKLLKPGESLVTAATWPDRLKLDESKLDPEMKAFIAANKKHGSWHYVDLPFQASGYSVDTPGAGVEDVVHMVSTCVDVLKGKSDRFSKRHALFLLTHYVGDIHQPLHVACGYVAKRGSTLVFVDPSKDVEPSKEDNGGNGLRFRLTPGGTLYKLHSFWDSETVDQVVPGSDLASGALSLIQQVQPKPSWKTSGDASTWSTQWANEALIFSRASYRRFKLTGVRPVTDPKEWPRDQWYITVPSDYLHDASGLIRVQLAKGGYRLAALLKEIWP